MPSRKVPFVNNEYYHIFNRGVMQIPIFNSIRDYKRFLKTIVYYQLENPKPRFSLISPLRSLSISNKKIVEIVCYCLMPNHFHFLLKQLREYGITEFVSKLSNSYTKYFNIKGKRIGPLFQGEFKSIHIETNDQLIHLSRYIHLNPLIGYKTKYLEEYKWSSYLEYLNLISTNTCSQEIILNQFKSPEEYNKFVLNHEDYARKLAMIKHQLLDS